MRLLLLPAALAVWWSCAAAQEPRICQAGELTLFSCVLKSGQRVGFCLNTADLKTVFAVGSPSGERARSPATRLREATVVEAARGDSIALAADTREGSVSLYVDYDADDRLPAVLVTKFGHDELREPCADETFEADSASLVVNGQKKTVDLLRLSQAGLARQLSPVPGWPD